jgi:hypothetical protein
MPATQEVEAEGLKPKISWGKVNDTLPQKQKKKVLEVWLK